MNSLHRKMPTCLHIHTTYFFQRVQGLSEVQPELCGAQVKNLCGRLVHSKESGRECMCPKLQGFSHGWSSGCSGSVTWPCNLTYPRYHAQGYLLHQDEVSGGITQPWPADNKKVLSFFRKGSGHHAPNAKPEMEGNEAPWQSRWKLGTPRVPQALLQGGNGDQARKGYKRTQTETCSEGGQPGCCGFAESFHLRLRFKGFVNKISDSLYTNK